MGDDYQEALQLCVEMSNTTTDMTTLDYLNQTFALALPTGGFVVLNTDAIHIQQVQLVQMAAVFAVQLGAALAVMVVLLLMTTPAKCKNLPFIFNILALVCDVARCILLIAQLNSGLSNFIVINLCIWDDPDVQQGINEGVAGVVFTFLLFVFIELALITQIRVVCAAASSVHRSVVTAVSVVIALLAIALRCYLTVINIRSIVDVELISLDSQETVSRAQYMANVSGVVSICVFSAIFCVKLALAIKSRRSMGLKQFGPMQIIFIMGCQTLVVPAIFSILAYTVSTGAQIQSCVETVVTIFLPLSSIWAAANTSAKLQNSNQTAVIALPEYKAKQHDPLPPTLTLNNETGDGLFDDCNFRSKYDAESQTSAHTIEKYLSGFTDRQGPGCEG